MLPSLVETTQYEKERDLLRSTVIMFEALESCKLKSKTYTQWNNQMMVVLAPIVGVTADKCLLNSLVQFIFSNLAIIFYLQHTFSH